MTAARCPACHAPAVIRAGRTALAHLTWCPHAPQPEPTPLPDWTTAPDALDLDDPAVLAALGIIAALDDDDPGEGGAGHRRETRRTLDPAVEVSLPPGGRWSGRSSGRAVSVPAGQLPVDGGSAGGAGPSVEPGDQLAGAVS